MAKGIVRCDLCGKEFEKEVRAINEARRGGWRIFCSIDCRTKARTTSSVVKCLACGKDVIVTAGEVRRSETGKFYCGSSCAARMRNLGRHRTEEEKEKISRSLFEVNHEGENWEGIGKNGSESVCCVCGNKFRHSVSQNRVVCSMGCRNIYLFGSLPYSKEEAIRLIREKRNETGDTPSTKEMGKKVVSVMLRYFRSWNEAMESLGYKPNTQWMSKKKLKCLDGHRADSISEMVVDNWLYEHGIVHERSKLYPEGRMNCDFFLPESNTWVEYFGLAGQHKGYDDAVLKKREIAKRFGMNLIEIKPCFLYPKMMLDKLLCVTLTDGSAAC